MTTGSSSSPRQRGATLIEVMVSMALVIIGLLGVYSAYTSSVRATSHGRRTSQATAKAERQMEILRNAPTAAIKCLAACGTPTTCTGSCAAACAATCCTNLPDGGINCNAGADGGVHTPACLLVPAPENDPSGMTYTYCDPTVRPDISLPYLYDVQVSVQYRLEGEQTQGTDYHTVVLRSALYKP